jgi:Zn-dependent peptidase ImmA (M78 family)
LVNVPFGFLFFERPPEARALAVADFRSMKDSEPIGQDFFDVFDDVTYKQDWYRELRQGMEAAPLPFVGKFANRRPSVATLSTDVKTTLKLSTNEMRQLRSAEDLFGYIAERAEDAGVLVFKNGVVGNNTHRPLSVSQFRGFALADKHAPVVFVNGADAKAAWAFTLLHELAHLWLGASAVSDGEPRTNHAIEALCNATAAEVLVPKAEFLAQWNGFPSVDSFRRIDELRRHFKVSALVIARCALDAGLIDRRVYAEVYAVARRATAAAGGGDFYRTLGTRNGRRFSDTVATLAHAGEISLRQAGRLLNTTPSNVLNYYDRRGAVST